MRQKLGNTNLFFFLSSNLQNKKKKRKEKKLALFSLLLLFLPQQRARSRVSLVFTKRKTEPLLGRNGFEIKYN